MIIKANKTTKGTANDKVMTPESIAKQLINLLPLKEGQTVLEPAKGTGNFYNNFPSYVIKSYCEIDEGIDFFNETNYYDWIITNPPYSIYDQFIEKSFELADNVVLLVPLSKIVSSLGRLKKIKEYGNPKVCHILGASKCGFPFGFPVAFVWFEKNYNGAMEWRIL